MKRVIMFAIILSLLSLTIVSAAKLEVSTTKETFAAGENITLKVSLLNDANNPITDVVEVRIENAEKTKSIVKTIPANELVTIQLEEGATHGYWNIVASYGDEYANGIFMVEMDEVAKFEIDEDKLVITNMGNTKYTKTVQIIIGDTIGIRNPDLEIGESIAYRLVAPDGDYNIKVTDGTTTLEKNSVKLTGTGQAIGALDQRTSDRSGITGGIAPEEDEDLALMNYIRSNKFIYIFIFIIFGAGVFIAIARQFRKSK
jgi:hypothetical protein